MVTVIIPTYKRDKYIDRAIKSILNQTYKDIEIIVVDDNDSNTEYRKLMEKRMEKYKDNPQVIYIKHERNKNGAAARNTGIKRAKGDYIAFLDDDDYYMPERLEKMVNALEQNKEFNAAYSSNIVTDNKKIIGYEEANKSGNFKRELLLGEFSFGSGSNMFFRADALRSINGFDESFQRHQDIETMLRYMNHNKILAVGDFLLVKSQDDRSNEPNIEKYIKVKEHYFEAFKNEVMTLRDEDQKRFYRNNYLQLAYEAVREKEKGYYKKYISIVEQYGKISTKEKIRIAMLTINNYIKIEKVKYMIKKIIINIKTSKEIKNIIKEYENV